MATTNTRSAPRPTQLWALWFGFLGAPIAWTAHLLVSYLLATYACRLMGAGAVRMLLIVETAALALIALGGMIVAYRAWRRSRTAGRSESGGPGGGTTWMALAGATLSTLFLLAIVMEGIPIIYLRSCG